MNIIPANKNLNIALEASAGSGKTFQLAMRVTAMLINGVKPEDILCLTFTNKATDEMLDRVLKILNQCVSDTLGNSELEIFEKVINIKDKNKTFKTNLIEMATKARNNLFKNFSSLKVMTIDAFCNSILKSFPFEAGIRPDFEITETEEDELTELSFITTLEELAENQVWKEIFKKSTIAFESTPIQQIDLLSEYARYTSDRTIFLKETLNNCVFNPNEILENIEEMILLKNKCIDNIKIILQDIDTHTLTEKQKKVRNKINNITQIKDIVNTTFFQKELNGHHFFKKFDFSSSSEDAFNDIRNDISIYLSLEANVAKSLSLFLGKLVYEKLKNLKQHRNILSFKDVSEQAYEMLASENSLIDKDYLYFRLDGRINHILIDEFQDTSESQWLTLKPLVDEAMAGIGQNDKIGSFFYVGDPKQNLYRFRGGSSSLFNHLINIYKDKLNKDTLLVNYRSEKHIVEFVNNVFRNIYQKFKYDDFKIFDINQKPKDENSAGYVEVSYIDKTNNNNRNETTAEFTVKKVMEVIDNNWNYKDIAILVHTNNDGINLKDALLEQNIPVKLETSNKLNQSNIFNIIISIAEFLYVESDDLLTKYLFTETYDINGDKYANNDDFYKIKNYIKKMNISGNTVFENIINVINNTDLQNRFINNPDFFLTLDVISKVAYNEKNIKIFLELVKKEAQNYNSITAENSNAVTIMTIHKSKGLEFPVVILPKLNRSLNVSVTNSNFFLNNNDNGVTTIEYLYSKNKRLFIQDSELKVIEDENINTAQDALNNLYVAMTRAENALIIGINETKENKENSIENILKTIVTIPYSVGTLCIDKKQEIITKESIKTFAYPTEIQEKTPLKEEKQVNFEATSFGTFLHKSIFYLNGFTDNHINIAIHNASTSNGAFINEKQKLEIESYLKELTQNNHWQNIHNGTVFKERKVTYDNNYFIIDFYSIFDDKIELIDFKTGNISDEQEKEYINQINRYAKVLKNLYNLKVNKYIYNFKDKKLNIIKVS